MGHGEVKRVDVTSPYRSLLFPTLELVLISGVAGIAVGWLDANAVDANLRNAVVGFALLLVFWRFILPLLRARRKRFIVTNQRILARASQLGGKADSIPLHDVIGVRRRRGGISLAIRGYDRTLYFPELPKPKKIERIIDEQLRELHSPVWR